MTNSEKDELAASVGLNLPDTISDEQAKYILINKNIHEIFQRMGGYGGKVTRQS